VLKNKHAMRLVWCFGLVIGYANTYGSIVGILCTALGYKDKAASLFGVVFIVGCIIGSAVFGAIVEMFKNYKFSTVVICGMGTISSAFVVISMHMNIIYLSCISFAFAGASLAILPVGIDFAVEMTYPVPEVVSTGLLMSMGNLIGLILTLVLGIVIGKWDHNGAYWAMGILSGIVFLSMLISCSIKEDLRRKKEERLKGLPRGMSTSTA